MIGAGPTALDGLARQLVVIGTDLMDLYTGPLTPAEIAAGILPTLRAEDRLEPGAYTAWIAEGGGYRVLTLADGSRWVLRVGDESERYVHIHPARGGLRTRRVRANVLKTAIMVRAYAGVHGGDSHDLTLVNTVRRQYLGLAPLRKFAGDHGLAGTIDLLAAGF